jgi:t-SNARE complex subunit (syntaxin)
MVEMTELHKEIYSIVHSESDQMNHIEYYVDTAQFNVEVGRKQLTLANKLRKKSLKTKILFGVGVIMVSLIIIIVI